MTIEERIGKLIGTSLNGRDLNFKVESYQNLLRIKIYYDRKWHVSGFFHPAEDDLSSFINGLMLRLIQEVDYQRSKLCA